ncbi:hypothetical protein AAW30_01602 [Arcobacter porcinus]|uniref:hypothetical protein n=1 Tax=Arcobacter porcinus TaxID=1935204 RepID=UPI0008255FD1|nr:hypothetical protein [Arcobacter porcinus]OCL82315.1 hypothetical protein AAW30_01602 [Arcobacter porcinus]
MDGQKISNNKMELNINEKLLYAKLQEQEGVQDILNQARDYQAEKVKKKLVEVYKEFGDLKNESTNKNKEDKKTETTSNKDTKIVPPKYTDVLDLVIKNTKDLIIQNIVLGRKEFSHRVHSHLAS